jgi:hypothetical protein
MIDKTKVRKIEKWFSTREYYDAPELGPRIIGFREGDPEGKKAMTTSIVESEGRYVLTLSGSVYWLGEPDPDFLDNLKLNSYPFDPESPINQVDRITVLLTAEEMVEGKKAGDA